MYRIVLYSPHLCVGFLFLNLYPAASASSSSASTIFVTHHLSHTICHTQLCHTPSFTHNFVTHHLSHTSVTHRHTSLSHTTLSHTIFHTSLSHTITHHCHTQLCHTPSFTHNFVTLALGHMLRGTLRGRRGTWRHRSSFCVAGVALGDIYLRFAWQASHLVTSTFVLWQAGHLWHWVGSGSALGPVFVAGDAGALCVAGVPLGDIHLRFTWQAWHLVTSTFVLWCGRRGTLWHWVGSGGALEPVLVAGDAAALCVAGVALVALGGSGGALGQVFVVGDARHFAWQAWHLVTSTFVSRGRGGTYGTGLALVARLGRF